MARLNYQKMIELLSVILHCPVCNNKYTAEQTSVIEGQEVEKREDAALLVHADCERCKSSVVFSVSLEGPEIFSVGMVTDLTTTDAKKFRDAGSISMDQIIDLQTFISSFDGDFEKVLK